MPDLDVDSARKAGVAVPPASKSDYIEATQQLQPGYVATLDATDPSIGWTVQHRIPDRDGADDDSVAEFTEPGDTLPGQVYLPGQLPDPAMAYQAGMMPVKVPEHLIVDDEYHIQGPEPSEMAILDARVKLRANVLSHRESVANTSVDSEAPSAAKKAEEPKAPAAPPANPTPSA